MYYINDKVKDKYNNDDYFDGAEYVKKIKDAVRNNDIKSIGVYGKWGVGKTSIIKNAISELIEEGEYETNNVVEYNAWKYNEYDFMRDFLIICSNKIEGIKKASEREESYYSDCSEDRQLYIMLWKKFWEFLTKSWRVLLFIFIFYILGIVLILFVNYLQPNWYDCADLITPLTLTVISFILPLFLVSEITHKSVSKKFSPEQFARDFNEIVKNRKILIFIDDIDRCNYEEIKSTFDTLKTFILDENYNVKFIIPVDPNILFNSLEDQTYDYFSKIIDYSIEVKHYTKVKFEPLKQEILENVDDTYEQIVSDGLYLASKFYIDTPRKMKKFANEFINEIYNYLPNEIRNKGYMFAKLIILKNEFPNYYINLVSNYNSTVDITADEIKDYNTKGYVDTNKKRKGIIFNNRLLDFLSKTDNVDLYSFPMYENKISYSEYKIKAICEEPTPKNRFDDDIRIDLKVESNYKVMEYELMENIIKPISSKKFLYSDPLKKICFLIVQFKSQLNTKSFEKFFDKIIDLFPIIKEDKNLCMEMNDSDEYISYINIPYITDCITDYIVYLNNNELDLLNDKIIINIINLINDSINEDYSYIKNDLIDFINFFKNCKDISNEKLINIIQKFLDDNFNKYYKEFDWYFILNAKSGNKCYVNNIINELENDSEANEEMFLSYLSERYTSRNCQNYFDAFKIEIDKILSDPVKFRSVIVPLIKNLKGKEITFEAFEEFLLKTNLINSNDDVNQLILKIIVEMKFSLGFNPEKYNEIISKIGIEYNKTDPIRDELKSILVNFSIEEIKIVLGYDEENCEFNNFKLLKEYGEVFREKANLFFEIIVNSYCKNEGFVISKDIERHGIDLNKVKDKIYQLISKDINHNIYLADYFSKEEVEQIDFTSLNIMDIELEYIKNENIIVRISSQIKNILEDCLKIINNNKDDKEIVKQQIDRFLINAEMLYYDINYSDKTLWTKLKKLEEYAGYGGLIDTYYLPKLKEHKEIINLFFEGKYKDNYVKNNIYADKILENVKDFY